MSVCLSVQAITFECLDLGTSFLAWWYILTISRSSLSIKVIGSRSINKCTILTIRHQILLDQCMVYYGHQGQGYLKVKMILRSRSLHNRIVSVWISIPKQAVGFQPNAFLFTYRSLWDYTEPLI